MKISSVSAIIVAGGKGERMGGNVRKQYRMLGGMPVLTRALLAFVRSSVVDGLVLVAPAEDLAFCEQEIVFPLCREAAKPIHVTAGGPHRQASVYLGLQAVSDTHGIVLIHDGVRPFVAQDQIAAVIQGARIDGACIPGLPAVDTLKKVDGEGWITHTISRDHIRRAQTPQAFRYPLIRKAHDLAAADGVMGTDDASLVEKMGGRVRITPGDPCNIKITTPEDLWMAQGILMGRGE